MIPSSSSWNHTVASVEKVVPPFKEVYTELRDGFPA
jgi:hypothetical protein